MTTAMTYDLPATINAQRATYETIPHSHRNWSSNRTTDTLAAIRERVSECFDGSYDLPLKRPDWCDSMGWMLVDDKITGKMYAALVSYSERDGTWVEQWCSVRRVTR